MYKHCESIISEKRIWHMPDDQLSLDWLGIYIHYL